MSQDNTEQRRIKTTKRVFQIIELLMEEEGLRMTDVANQLEMSKSNTHRHLSTLKEEGYVVQEGELYHPSMQFLNIGEYVRNRKRIYGMVEPKVEQLANKTDERSEFLIEEHGHGVFVHRETGANAVHTNTRVGKTLPLHASAAGKAILAFTPPKRVDEIVEEHGLKRLTEYTITDYDALQSELAEIRETSIAYNDQELIVGLRAVGTPILGPEGEVLGGLSITGPTSRFTGETFRDEIPDLLRGVANELELNIAYS